MRHFVTYFDRNYLTRGLALYQSLERHCQSFHLSVLAFDEETVQILERLELSNMSIVPLSRFENEELLRVKPTRTRQEYCWTCTPAAVKYVLTHMPQAETVTYLDADLLFFASPDLIFDEAKDASIILTSHNWIPGYDYEKGSGKYPVQFVTFRRDPVGLEALEWWYARCIEWCHARFEDNKFGDQKYLDEWPERYPGVHVVRQVGAGVAPWNCGKFSVQRESQRIFVDGDPLIFYHFHAYKFYRCGVGYLYGFYPISHDIRTCIYPEYRRALHSASELARGVSPQCSIGHSSVSLPPCNPKEFYRFVRQHLKELGEGRYIFSNPLCAA